MIEIELVKPREMSVKKPQAGFERQWNHFESQNTLECEKYRKMEEKRRKLYYIRSIHDITNFK
jgi:hypothetical protein